MKQEIGDDGMNMECSDRVTACTDMVGALQSYIPK